MMSRSMAAGMTVAVAGSVTPAMRSGPVVPMMGQTAQGHGGETGTTNRKNGQIEVHQLA